MYGHKTVTTEDKDVARTLNQCFNTAINSIETNGNNSLLTDTERWEDSVEIAVK